MPGSVRGVVGGCCLVAAVVLGGSKGDGAPPIGLAQWDFDRRATAITSPEARNAVSPGVWRGTTENRYSEDVPAPYIYDPLTKRSRPNRASAVFQGAERSSDAFVVPVDFAKLGLSSGSWTLEGFVKPDAMAGAADAWVLGKAATSEQGAELSVDFIRLHNHGTTFFGVHHRTSGNDRNRQGLGHYSSTSRLDGRDVRWRHVAVVYDAASKTMTGWLDYHLTRRTPLAEPLTWDAGPILIGGRPDHWGILGLIDEVRLSRGALSPAEFLRARADAIEGATFTSTQTVVPLDAGCYDVKTHFGAAGDGKTDDTAAFNNAFAHLASKIPLAYNTLIIPPGEYLITGTVWCSRFIDVKGAGPDQTVLRLKDGVFTDPDQPKPVLRMSSTEGDPGSHPWVNGSSISIYLDGLTINTGRGNPGAKALEYHSNNVGRLEHVVLKSEDGQGVLGLDLMHHDVGPALAKYVTIEGFDIGTAIRYQEYSHTFEHLTLRNQRVMGIRNQGNILAIRGLKSMNRVPAIVCEGANSMLTLLDSELSGGAADQPAIQAAGALYALRVKTAGYGHAIDKGVFNRETKESTTERIAGPDLDEYIGDRAVPGFGDPKGALKLPIEETPEPPLPPVDEWVSVARFAEHKVGNDWSPAVQRAIDSGAKVIYFPRTESYEYRTPIRLHAPVQRLVGFGGEVNWHPDVWQRPAEFQQTDPDSGSPPLLIYDEPNPEHVVVLDRLGCQHVRHASPATLVLRSSSPDRYSTGLAGGKLFAEDIGGADWHIDHPQRIWVRQWNPESHAAGPCIHTRGATLWALGFKTEYESQKLLAEAGAQTEILGAFIYPIGKIPEDRPLFENRDSAMALIYGASVYQSNHKIHVRDRRGDEVRDYGNDVLTWPGSRARMDLFVTDGRAE